MSNRLKLKVRTKIPAALLSGIGTTVTKDGLTYRIDLDYSQLQDTGDTFDPNYVEVAIWNPHTDEWARVSLTNFLSGSLSAATFDAISPTTTRGDLIYRGATANTRLPAGAAGYFLQANGAGTDPSYAGFLQNGTGAATRTWLNKARDVISVKDFGAVGDGITVAATVSITSGTNTLTATGATFASSDVGKRIVVPGAGASGAPLATTISAFTDTTHVTLGTNAGTTISAVFEGITYGTDDTAAIQAALNAFQGAGTPPSEFPFFYNLATIYFPTGIYCVSASLLWRAGTNILLSAGARVKAMASIANAVIDTPAGTFNDQHNCTELRGGLIDASDLASYAIRSNYFANTFIKDLVTYSPLIAHIQLGNAGAPASSYGAFITDVVCRRGLTPFPTGLIGINFTNCGDSHVVNSQLIGVKYGINGTIFDSKFDRVHVWNPGGVGTITSATVALTSGFAITGSQNIFSQCQVDGPFVNGGAGFDVISSQNVYLGCSVNNAGVGSDNNSNGFFIETGASACTIIGCTLKGDGSRRLSADVAGELTNLTYVGNYTSSCVTSIRPRFGPGNYLVAGAIGCGDYTVATLPASPTRGDRAFVHDATSTTFASVVAGGGANWVPVVYNGANWLIG
ncbi:hypothetical protein [Bradyrhizobium elkanii]|uniref:hypothetical protein n=1 Tax=Bradyrhizobium elkanii TaxID=29448 RepID=UPI003D257930